jgi:hypothetical protein
MGGAPTMWVHDNRQVGQQLPNSYHSHNARNLKPPGRILATRLLLRIKNPDDPIHCLRHNVPSHCKIFNSNLPICMGGDEKGARWVLGVSRESDPRINFTGHVVIATPVCFVSYDQTHKEGGQRLLSFNTTCDNAMMRKRLAS